ncbi:MULTISPECIES: CapA family protein [unclassified Streptomyces]|uniref:CapA family protein n=1 Tax=unclassified Streptomyces TaxID=2593676 RepID=UPI001BE9D28A|nr:MULTISPECIES: CapA family protein [unclassified Streptomyces]MBT2407899.1 CapA family protein [Streptomyces sp. ISL-21]MBT2613369.1 CapA family protein [Streptomyces sp. ISL-87]
MTKRTRQALALLSAVLLSAVAGCSAAGGSRSSAPARLGNSREPAPSSAAGSTSDTAARGFTLVASGDVLPHTSVIRQGAADAGGDGYDFRPMFSGVKPVVSAADLALCHMETIYGEDDGPFTGYPAFKSPPEIADGLKDAGYDGCSTASNHTLDDGADGLKRTLDKFDKVGLKHAGSARTAAEAATATMYTAGSAKVAHLAYTFDTNGYPMPDGQPWAVNLMEQEKIIADARAARKAGADVVLVSVHWGTEWQTEPDEKQLSLGRALTASQTGGRPDIDLVLGTHAHIPQAYEKVNGTWIIYGMGDQIAGQMFNHTGATDPRGSYGSIGRFTFAPPAAAGQRWQVTKAEFIPQWMDIGAGKVVNLPEGLAKHPDRDDYETAQDAISEAVLSRGAAKDGLTMGM